MFNKHQRVYKSALKRMLNSEDGKIAISEWKSTYVNTKTVSATPELTYYNLALKEFILSLLLELEQPLEINQLNEIIIDDGRNSI